MDSQVGVNEFLNDVMNFTNPDYSVATFINATNDLESSLFYKTSKINFISRLVDFEKIIKGGIYHPKFYGSSSIKKTLPALVPEMTYEGIMSSHLRNC
ncbi:MAG: hypothetical protein DWQ06_13655 [Calditrichaeota bacterium]|nr:MAG: hypothetical protein DWQ06_13655 [Calditrichota bacterium]